MSGGRDDSVSMKHRFKGTQSGSVCGMLGANVVFAGKCRRALLTGGILLQTTLAGCVFDNTHYFGIAEPLEAVGAACNAVDARAIYGRAFAALSPYDGIIFHGVDAGYRNASEQSIVNVDGGFARTLLSSDDVIVPGDGASSGSCRVTFRIESFFTSFKAARRQIEYRVELTLRDQQIQRICLGLKLDELGGRNFPEGSAMRLDLEKYPNLKEDMIVAKSRLDDGADGKSYKIVDIFEPEVILGSPCFDASGKLTGYKQLFPELEQEL